MFDLVPLDDDEIAARKARKEELRKSASPYSLAIGIKETSGFVDSEGDDEIIDRLKPQVIARLNDDFRRNIFRPRNGRVVHTLGIDALGIEMHLAIRKQVANFNDFTKDNNPHGERDMGMFEFAGHRIMWKIDYYDLSYTYGSDDPSNVNVTNRVLTIMLSQEY